MLQRFFYRRKAMFVVKSNGKIFPQAVRADPCRIDPQILGGSFHSRPGSLPGQVAGLSVRRKKIPGTGPGGGVLQKIVQSRGDRKDAGLPCLGCRRDDCRLLVPEGEITVPESYDVTDPEPGLKRGTKRQPSATPDSRPKARNSRFFDEF
jgi:hypothetical protein